MKNDNINNRIKNLNKLLDGIKSSEDKPALEMNDINQMVQESQSQSIHQYIESEDFLTIKNVLESFPASNGTRYFNQLDLRLGFMTDDVTFKYYKHVAQTTAINPENYLVESDHINVLFVYMTREFYKTDLKEVTKVIRHFKEINIPVILFMAFNSDKEGKSKAIAKLSDVIFSTSANKVNQLKEQLEKEEIYQLSEGFNPIQFNPIGLSKISNNHVMHKFDMGDEELTELAEYAANNGELMNVFVEPLALTLFQYKLATLKYKAIYPILEGEIFNHIYKLARFNLFVNKKKWAFSGFEKEVFESLASGNIVLSNFSLEISNTLPSVIHVFSENEMKHILHEYSEEELYRMQIANIRNVFRHQTSFEVFRTLFAKAGILPNAPKKKVLVIVDQLSESIQKKFAHQSYAEKELILRKDVTNRIFENYDFVTFFTDKHLYEEYYLEDMVNAFKYTNASFVTKDAYMNGNHLVTGVEHDYVEQYQSKYQTVFAADTYNNLELIEESGYGDGYSIDHFEFIANHVPVDVKEDGSYKISVLVPIYNNGELLIDRCFNSLIRSTMFNDLEIILVDDGSTDGFTPAIVNRLTRHYKNVKSFIYTDGGSGSASRPKNKALEMATTDYIVILDPDDEIVAEGYEKLYREAQQGDYDIVFGNRTGFGEVYKLTNNYNNFVETNNGLKVSNSPREWLIGANFKHINNQVMIIKRDLIVDNQLSFIEGAVSQDVVFGNLLFLVADKVKAIDEELYIYYSGIAGSITNSTHSLSYFKKLLILEENRVHWLKKYEVFDIYCENRIEYIFNNHFKKLSNVNEADALNAVEILYEIYKMYLPNIQFEKQNLQKFVELASEGKFGEVYEQLVLRGKKSV